MSHFPCAVITDGTKTVRELMAPYQENNMDTVPREFLEFFDVTDEYLERYRNEDITFCFDPDDPYGPVLHPPYSDACRRESASEYSLNSDDYETPEGWIETKIPLKLIYSTFDDFMRYHIGEERDENGKYGYWENPNAKWDWYEEYGTPSWVDDYVGNVPVRLDDIKFDPDENERKAREFIREHPAGDESLHGLERYLRMRDMTDEQYIEAERHLSLWSCITPDGKWHEAAKMHAFGISDSDMSGDDFYKWSLEFKKRFIDPYDGSCVLHVVDCHI